MQFNSEDEGSAALQNLGIQPPHCMVKQLRKPRILSSLLKYEISHRLRECENWVLEKIFGPKREEVMGDWRK
jgi:hypothetical protein